MALAREGASIVACDILDQVGSVKYPLSTRADLDETAHRVEAAGGRFIGVKADVRDPQAASGVIGLAKSLALELAAHGITVNCVCPTSVNTPLVDNPVAWHEASPDDATPPGTRARSRTCTGTHSRSAMTRSLRV